MQNEQKKITRQSPYLKANILKYCPSSLIPPDGNSRNHLQIDTSAKKLSQFISYSNYVPEKAEVLVESPCYFCKKISTIHCSDCKKVICQECKFSCGKCGKILCKLSKTYDYSLQTDCCYDC